MTYPIKPFLFNWFWPPFHLDIWFRKTRKSTRISTQSNRLL